MHPEDDARGSPAHMYILDMYVCACTRERGASKLSQYARLQTRETFQSALHCLRSIMAAAAMMHAKMLFAQTFPSIAPAPSELLLEWRHHIKDKFPSVQHISCDDLHARLQGGHRTSVNPKHQTPLLLDCRTQPEHSCSHIAGSVRVDPDATAADIMSLLQQNDIAVASSTCPFSIAGLDASCGRFAVLYCSIGYRSSAAAARILQTEVIRLPRFYCKSAAMITHALQPHAPICNLDGWFID